MRILITGGAGFIGSNLIAQLRRNRKDVEIIVLDNESSGRFSDILDFDIRAIKADIRDQNAIADALHGVDTLVHLAADTRVMDSIADPRKNFEVNVAGTFQLLLAARTAKVGHVVNASTGGAILGEARPPIHEELAAHPQSPYGASKLAVEGYLSAFSGAYGLPAVSLRFSNIFGPRSYHKGSVVAHFFKKILNGEQLDIFGDGSQVRDYLFVKDLAVGIDAAIEKRSTGVIQLGSGRPTPLRELVDAMARVCGPLPPIVHHPARAGEIHTTWCDITRARRELGFDPATVLEAGLRETWDWFRQAQGL